MITLFFLVLLLTLNPYTIIGPLGYYVALPFAVLVFLFGMGLVRNGILFSFLICIAISVFGVFSSVLHSIPQVEHLKIAISILVYYIVGVGLHLVCGRKCDVEDVALLALWGAVINGVVILLQVQFPQFRAALESVFVESGNIDWTEGFRYRGLASGGGASLSVFSAFVVYICLYLRSIGRVSVLASVASLAVLLISVFFIGRTGVFLIAVAFFLFVLTHMVVNIRTMVPVIFFVVFVVFFGVNFIREFLIQEYGESFYMYSLGFILEGRQGIEAEGTIGMIAEFLAVVPARFPEVLIGYGFYGGSDFNPWTDSGYARMFLSVGFLLGCIFYCCAFYIFAQSAGGKWLLFWPLIFLLLIAEAKEGLLFGGYSSRLLFILMGFWGAQKMRYRRQANKLALSAAMSK